MSQASVSRIFEDFITAMMTLVESFIKFPQGARETSTAKRKFFEKCGIPNIIGVIDGTHIYITKPNQPDWNVFLNRNNKFSMNIQIVCSDEMRLLNVVANWPGGTHDSFIWRYSAIREILQKENGENFLLGDSGYPLEPWCITPYSNPRSHYQERYNDVHRRTRSVVERTIGCLKRRFRLLDLSGGILQYTPQKVCKIVMAASVLHNICLDYSVPLPDEPYNLEIPDPLIDPPNSRILLESGRNSRKNRSNFVKFNYFHALDLNKYICRNVLLLVLYY
nr:putative nuclease HARBI1 [Parasteatoda tepidariorum]